MKRTFFLILLFFCALFVKADVLGPYTMDSNVPPTPTGYARVVLPIGGADASVAVSITVWSTVCFENYYPKCCSILLFLGLWRLPRGRFRGLYSTI